MGWYDFYPRARPNPKALPGRNRKTYGETWWGKRWIDTIESFGWSNRLQRGMAYARAGMVKSYKISNGMIKATVKGSRPSPYTVTIKMKTISDSDWAKVRNKLLSKAIFCARLLCGEMPHDIENVFSAAKLSLFPSSSKDIKLNCSCPDWAVPCKHIAAVFYELADAFDEDPFLLFEVRGKEKKIILKELREKRSIKTRVNAKQKKEDSLFKDYTEPLLESRIPNFWQAGKELRQVTFELSPPPVSGSVIKRLGKPGFWESKINFENEMIKLYSRISERALEIAMAKSDAPKKRRSVPAAGIITGTKAE